MKVTAIIDDTSPDNSIEKVVINRQDSIVGQVPFTTFITIFDDGDNECTFHYYQMKAIIYALQEAEEKWESMTENDGE